MRTSVAERSTEPSLNIEGGWTEEAEASGLVCGFVLVSVKTLGSERLLLLHDSLSVWNALVAETDRGAWVGVEHRVQGKAMIDRAARCRGSQTSSVVCAKEVGFPLEEIISL